MKIGIDLRVLPEKKRSFTGVANYAFLLTKYLLKLKTNHEFVLFIKESLRESASGGDEVIPSGDLPKGDNPMFDEIALLTKSARNDVEVVYLPDKTPFIDSHIKSAKLISDQNLDIFHGPAFTLPLGFNSKLSLVNCRTVVTVHDLAIYKHPEWFPRGQWFSTKFLVPRSIKKADKIIVPSESTKQDLIELFHVPSFKIDVIPLGVEEDFIKHETRNMKHDSSFKFQVSKPYILCVATLEPRKNLVRLIEAYSRLPKELINKYDLVIAGGKGWKYKDILLKIGNCNLEIKQKIKLVGPVGRKDLIMLYQKASLFVFPSLYEGFGLPVLEAMAAEVPVISSNISSIPEFASGSAILINPYKTDEISKAIETALKDKTKASEMASIGAKKAALYTWEKTAKRTMEIYEKGISRGLRF